MVAMVKPYRHPKTGIFWIRKVIPEKLRSHFGGRREFKVTLRTREPQEAKLLANRYLAEFEHRLQGALRNDPGTFPCSNQLPRMQKLSGAVIEGIHNPSPMEEISYTETLLDVFDPWRREAQPKDKTTDEYKKTVQEFHECVGMISLQAIRTTHIRIYKDALVSNGSLAAGSINKRVGVIKTLLNFAKINGFIDSNPAEGVKVRRTKAVGQRHPFTNEEIKKIFSSSVFQSNHRPKAGANEAAYWMPILAYHTGARLEEIGQLSVGDVQEHEGIWFLEITEDHGDMKKSVKTEAGKRIIPLHNDLLRLGFLEFVASQKADGRLFSALKADRYGSRTQNWSKWWSRYIKKTVGICEEGKTFHAFRHTFAQLWKESGADPIMKDATLGHSAGNTVQDRYGGWRNPNNGRTYIASPAQLNKELMKVTFDVAPKPQKIANIQ